ncbi:MAG: hypothetical protein AB1916_11830 [Thermodesulfobacteriota bacterium]
MRPSSNCNIATPAAGPQDEAMPFASRFSRFYFDRRDHQLLSIVSDVLAEDSGRGFKRLLAPSMHPRGIKEMAATRGLRIAYAVMALFRSLERGRAGERLSCLRALHEETLASAHTHLRMNTARVLLSIMKALAREKDEVERLKLARDFRMAAAGKPRVIAAQLTKYHLVEMPEDWNQLAFDDHVHDANTKGRKSATHLIMDAWIKGIRRLTVVYYNHVPPEVAEELLEAAAIVGIKVRVGIEFCAPFRGRLVRFTWTLRGFTEPREFLDFLYQPDTSALMAEGREVTAYQEQYVFAALEQFNVRHRPDLNQEFGLNLPPLPRSELLALVGEGQASLHHLGKLVHDRLFPLMAARTSALHSACSASAEERRAAEELVGRMDALDIDTIIERWLRPQANPHLTDPSAPSDEPGTPGLMRVPPAVLLARLAELHPGHAITLGLSSLRAEDVLELLHDCGGLISHLEIFNYKDWAYDRCTDFERIIALQQAINSRNAVRLKRAIASIRDGVDKSGQPDAAERREKLTLVLRNMAALRAAYAKAPLRSRVGTDSTGSSRLTPGMGLVVADTLPRSAQRRLNAAAHGPASLPVQLTVFRRRTYLPRENGAPAGPRTLFSRHRDEWVVDAHHWSPKTRGNLRLLGGFTADNGNGLRLDCDALPETRPRRPPLRYLNTNLKNVLKVLAGFVPAFATFFLTKDWWVLAWLGAFIWFGITGVRNVIQSVLGGGGLRRSPLLRWWDFVSWDRLSDSLLFTGFSVPLLDWLVKNVIMAQGMGITTHTNPVALYSVMAVVNGLYLMSHNLLRGLPRAAAFGNLLRSVISIPLALALNGVAVGLLEATGMPPEAAHLALQKWAAIISKLASDCVAAIIEGLADRRQNLRLRDYDFGVKLRQVFDTFARLELAMPTTDVAALLATPERLVKELSGEGRDLLSMIIVNTLDLLYFWMYQPRARQALRRSLAGLTREERRAFLLSQLVLQREREISQMFLDGLVGKNFASALAFYLHRYPEYLEDLQEMAREDLPEAGAQAAA